MIAIQERTWREAAKAWSDGDIVWSVGLGGLGPDYEQCIQIIVFETLSRWGTKKEWEINSEDLRKYPEEFTKHFDSVVTDLDKTFGFSGAQVAAAKNLAFKFMHYGYQQVLEKVEDDRKIQVCRDFPVLG